MTKKELWYYHDLFTTYQQLSNTVNWSDKAKCKKEMDVLAEKDPELKKVLLAINLIHRVRSLNRYVYLGKLEEFSEGKQVALADSDLVNLANLYQYDPEFRSMCDAEPGFHQAMIYWLGEYHRKVTEHEDIFTAHLLLGKLEHVIWGRLGLLDPPIEFDETEIESFAYLYQTNPEFRTRCDERNIPLFRDVLMILLEERQSTSDNSTQKRE